MQGFKEEQIGVERYLNLRYDGTDVPVMTAFAADATADPAKAFEEQYKREFGFVLEVSFAALRKQMLVSDEHLHALVGDVPVPGRRNVQLPDLHARRSRMPHEEPEELLCECLCAAARILKHTTRNLTARGSERATVHTYAGPGHHCGRCAGAGHWALRGAAQGRRCRQEPRCALMHDATTNTSVLLT